MPFRVAKLRVCLEGLGLEEAIDRAARVKRVIA